MKKIKIHVERAEVRNGSIILKFKPDLLSGQTFAVNPFYDDGDKKNQMQTANFAISLTEDHGEIKDVRISYNGYHSTKGHSQLHNIQNEYCFDRKELAINWFTERINPDNDYLNDHKKSAIKHWSEIDSEFVPILKQAIENREREFHFAKIKAAKLELHNAMTELDKLLLKEF